MHEPSYWRRLFSATISSIIVTLIITFVSTSRVAVNGVTSFQPPNIPIDFIFPMNIILGVVFAFILRQRGLSSGGGLVWGLAYGVFLWVAIILTLLPILEAKEVAWALSDARNWFHYLAYYVLFGSLLGLSCSIGDRKLSQFVLRLRGKAAMALAGVFVGGFSGWILSIAFRGFGPASQIRLGQFQGTSEIFLGAILGLTYSSLYSEEANYYGSSIGWGLAVGLTAWLMGPFTLGPVISGLGPLWARAQARELFAGFIGFLIYGAFIALSFVFVRNLWRAFFVDVPVLQRDSEAFGIRNLHALLGGILASIAGGFAFSFVMIKVGMLPAVASLVGSRSEITGFLVHMTISSLVGGIFGLLFRKDLRHYMDAMGWGLIYGLFWWLVGPLTLMPILLGGIPQWSVDAIREAFPSLIGHFFYGAVTGLLYYRIAISRDISYSRLEEAPMDRREIGRTPAFWGLLLTLVIVTLLILS